jgi:hypothetical protein
MSIIRCITAFLLAVLCYQNSSAQKVEYFLVGNANLYFPNSDSKNAYPILWLDKDEKPKFQAGGFGLGVSRYQEINSNLLFKAEVGAQRVRYWDESFNARDGYNNSLGSFSRFTTEYSFNMNGVLHYSPGERFSIGTGLSLHILLSSVSKVGQLEFTYPNHYKPVMPLIPLELTMKFEKTVLNLRYERGLLNKNKADLAEEAKENYSMLVFQFGYKLK